METNDKPTTAKECFERIERMEGLRDEAQRALDRELLNLRELMGATFEYEGNVYQIRVPNTKRTDRKYAAAAHPFIVPLKVMPKAAKAAAKAKKVETTEEEAQANLEAIVASATEEETLEAEVRLSNEVIDEVIEEERAVAAHAAEAVLTDVDDDIVVM